MQTPILTKKWNSCLISIFNWKEIIYSVLNGLFHSTGKDRFSGHLFSGNNQFSTQIVRKMTVLEENLLHLVNGFEDTTASEDTEGLTQKPSNKDEQNDRFCWPTFQLILMLGILIGGRFCAFTCPTWNFLICRAPTNVRKTSLSDIFWTCRYPVL